QLDGLAAATAGARPAGLAVARLRACLTFRRADLHHGEFTARGMFVTQIVVQAKREASSLGVVDREFADPAFVSKGAWGVNVCEVGLAQECDFCGTLAFVEGDLALELPLAVDRLIICLDVDKGRDHDAERA